MRTAILFNKIMSRIDSEERALLRRKFALFSVLFAGFFSCLFPAIQLIREELAESSFSTYLSLFFSDSKEVIASWPSFSFAILESLPVMSVVLILTFAFLLLQFLKFFAQNAKPIYGLQRIF